MNTPMMELIEYLDLEGAMTEETKQRFLEKEKQMIIDAANINYYDGGTITGEDYYNQIYNPGE